jgi:hypothetical protein
MAPVEIFAISSIFLSGFYVGFKLKSGLLYLKEYLKNRRNIN